VAISANRLLGITLDSKGAPVYTVLDGNLSIIPLVRQMSVALGATTIAENQPSGSTIGQISTTDNSAGHTYTYALVSGDGGADNGSFVISAGALKTAASFDFETKSNYSIRVRSSDEGGTTSEQTFTIRVTNVNEAPTATDKSYETPEDVLLSIPAPGLLLNSTDPENDPLRSSVVDLPAHGQLTLAADGGFSYQPAGNYNGEDRFTYRTNDGALSGNVATVVIRVTPVNDAPVAANDRFDVVKNHVREVAAPGVLDNDTDTEGDDLSAVLESDAAHGHVTLNSDGSFAYTPDDNFAGTDEFTYRADDGQLLGDPATVTLVVAAVNHAPTARDDAAESREDTPLTIPVADLLANDDDQDGDRLQVLIVVSAEPAHGKLSVGGSGDRVVYTPDPNYHGTDSFEYRASDGDTVSGIATVSITVLTVNDAPSFTSGADQHLTDLAGSQSIKAWATNISPGPADEAGQQVHFVVTGNSNEGLFAVQPAIDARGTLTFTPLEEVSGVAEISVVLMDDGGTENGASGISEPRTFTIQIDWAQPWHNRDISADVTDDGEVAADDVIKIINHINAAGSGPLPNGSGIGALSVAATGVEGDGRYYDVTGDDYVAADDVIAVINYINAHNTNQAPATEGEASSDLMLLLAMDVAEQGTKRK
jgi:VCBS repeat-containing protein